MEPRSCYCKKDGTHPEYLQKMGIPPGFCGECDICKKPGHTCHFPGLLPYTGGWCDEHYEQIATSMREAISPEEPYGLRDANRRYFRLDGRIIKRLLIFTSREPDAYLEYRSNWVARWLSVNEGRNKWELHRRWDHPLGVWLNPLGTLDQRDWVEIAQEEFDKIWQEGIQATGDVSDTK